MISWLPSLPAIIAEDFKQAIVYDPIVVILMWAVWDPTSRGLDSRLQQSQRDYANLHFYAMDLDREQNWPLAMEWGILVKPTLVCLFNGVFHELLAGSKPESQMRAKLADWDNLSIAQE